MQDPSTELPSHHVLQMSFHRVTYDYLVLSNREFHWMLEVKQYYYKVPPTLDLDGICMDERYELTARRGCTRANLKVI